MEKESMHIRKTENSGQDTLEALARVLEIIRRLRAPDGCPWDREQTPNSIRKYIREESYELLEAIDRSDVREVCEELGDITFLLFFLSFMYEEQRLFTLADVFHGSADKMIRRHPHIFGDTEVSGTGEVLANWQEIKRQEAEKKGRKHSVLGNLPKGLPALQYGFRLGERAARVNFDWKGYRDILAKIEEESAELSEAVTRGDTSGIEEEIGDLLFTLCNLARHLDVNPEDALNRVNRKFTERFHEMEKRLEKMGIDPASAGPDTMNMVWDEVKRDEKGRS